MDTQPQRTVGSRIYSVSTWALIVYFGAMALVHLVLAVLFYLGAWDTGVGYFLDYDLPAWLIALLDGMAAVLLWTGYRRRIESPRLGLLLTVVASIIMLGRALWFVIIPPAVVLTIAGSIRTSCRQADLNASAQNGTRRRRRIVDRSVMPDSARVIEWTLAFAASHYAWV